MSELPCKRLLLGVCGSIHAVHLPQYILELRTTFATEMKLICTESALSMMPAAALEVFASGQVYSDLWSPKHDGLAPHVALARWAELFAIVPATANSLGKIANGIADDLLTTTALAHEWPLVIAPAMNPAMWKQRSVQRNVEQLRADGHYVIDPTDVISVTGSELGSGLGPRPEEFMPHLWHVHLARLRECFWEEATANAPASRANLAAQGIEPSDPLSVDQMSQSVV